MVKGISKNVLRDLLNLAAKESILTFNNTSYTQLDGVAMGSHLGSILANIFLSHHEENWLNKCPTEFKPGFYRRNVDDIFVFLYFLNHLNLPTRFANICPLNIRT